MGNNGVCVGAAAAAATEALGERRCFLRRGVVDWLSSSLLLLLLFVVVVSTSETFRVQDPAGLVEMSLMVIVAVLCSSRLRLEILSESRDEGLRFMKDSVAGAPVAVSSSLTRAVLFLPVLLLLLLLT